MNYIAKKIKAFVKHVPFSVIADALPIENIKQYYLQRDISFRSRKYDPITVMSGIIYQASQEDKSLQHTVNYIAEYHTEKKNEYNALKEEVDKKKKVKRHYDKPGRPKSELPVVQKSLFQQTSINTSSYDEARQRLPLEIVRMVFEKNAKQFLPKDGQSNWNGHPVFIADGTKFSTPSTLELKEYFTMNQKDANPFPIGRIEGIINLYNGGIIEVRIDNDKSSELRMLKDMYGSLPVNGILLADHLYSSYGHLAFAQSQGKHVIAQRKTKRKEKYIRDLGQGDCLVEITKQSVSKVFETKENPQPEQIIVRKIQFTNPKKPEKQIVLYTTLLDPQKYPANDITALFQSRWQIELTFRDIKTILKMHHMRSKTTEMVIKEIYAHLILYNLVRTIMPTTDSSGKGAFPPSGRSIQTRSANNKKTDRYIDKIGRSYSRHGGRRSTETSEQVQTKKTTGQK